MIDVGSQVVCITSQWYTYSVYSIACLNIPKKGQVYTVREVLKDGLIEGGTDYFLRLAEIVNKPYDEGYVEPYFQITAFRPVKKTSISTFTEMLVPSRILEDA